MKTLFKDYFDLRDVPTDALIEELKRRKKSGERTDVIRKEELEKYLNFFNKIKNNVTGIKSKYSTNNAKIVTMWNLAVINKTDSDMQTFGKDLANSLQGALSSDWHRDNNWKYITPDLFLRTDKREYWLGIYHSMVAVPKERKNHKYGNLNLEQQWGQ